MPSSRRERVLACAGALLTTTLLVLVVIAWREYQAAEPPSFPALAAAAVSEVVVETIADVPPPAPSRETHPPSPAPDVARMTVIAARGPCWLEVRRGGPAGEVSFVGLLAQRGRRTFRGRVVWVTLGAGQNVDVRLNGEPADVPAGVSTLSVRATGIRPAAPQG